MRPTHKNAAGNASPTISVLCFRKGSSQIPSAQLSSCNLPALPRDLSPNPPTMNGEDPQERTEQIRNIISGLERYNPQAAEVLEAYLQQQCEEKFCDCNANRALLKL